MNKNKIIELLEDGAYFDMSDSKLVHPSFRKGWRMMHPWNISWAAVERFYRTSGRLVKTESNVYSLTKNI